MQKFVEKEDNFYDLINTCPEKSKNLEPQGSLCVLVLVCVFFIFHFLFFSETAS